jgi:hypothetical protein
MERPIMLRQIFYVSRAQRPFSEAELQALLHLSQRNNRLRDVTGCLMYSGQHFAQTLEGQPQVVGELVARIGRDPRHNSLAVVLDQPATRRMHPDWSMGYVYSLDLADRLEAWLNAGPLSQQQGFELMSEIRTDSLMGPL